MKKLDFCKIYPDEESCKVAFRALREKQGIKCPKCSGDAHYWMPSLEKWECKSCHYRLSLKCGTVMQSSKLPFLYWFTAMHLMSSGKEGISALALQEELGHTRYEPIWAMMHKIRSMMGKRDDMYDIEGTFELDEGFFEHVILNKELREEVDQNGPKRGRGSEEKTKVLVMVGSEPVEDHDPKLHDKDRKCGYIKMKVIGNLQAETIESQVLEHVDKNAKAETDDSTSYTGLAKILSGHTIHNASKTDVCKALPWVHTAISNAKRKILGTFYMVGDKYMQNYLNEFCYLFNRRYFKERIFDRILIAALSYTPNLA